MEPVSRRGRGRDLPPDAANAYDVALRVTTAAMTVTVVPLPRAVHRKHLYIGNDIDVDAPCNPATRGGYTEWDPE